MLDSLLGRCSFGKATNDTFAPRRQALAAPFVWALGDSVAGSDDPNMLGAGSIRRLLLPTSS